MNWPRLFAFSLQTGFLPFFVVYRLAVETRTKNIYIRTIMASPLSSGFVVLFK